jgi:hypothetical protein
MILMIFYRRIPDKRDLLPNSINLGFATESIANKVIQQQRELLHNIGISSLTSPFNYSKMHEVDSMVKEDFDRKIRALTRQSEDFDKIG